MYVGPLRAAAAHSVYKYLFCTGQEVLECSPLQQSIDGLNQSDTCLVFDSNSQGRHFAKFLVVSMRRGPKDRAEDASKASEHPSSIIHTARPEGPEGDEDASKVSIRVLLCTQ